MSNKFLGLDSVNVLVKYIDEQFKAHDTINKVVTIFAFRYIKDNISYPVGPSEGEGGFDFIASSINYPDEWRSLDWVLDYQIGSRDRDKIEAALADGAIYMVVGTVIDSKTIWTTPIRISGQNGVSVRFKYSHNPDADVSECNDIPNGVSASNPFEYVWTKYGDNAWVGPAIWAVYSTNANIIQYRYRITADIPENGIPAPTGNNDPDWMTTAANPLSQDKPFMWMSWKYVPAYDPLTEEPSNEGQWSEPILFGHWGLDGKDGLDGNIPDYSITLYAASNNIDNIPSFNCNVGDKLEDVLTNNSAWDDIPTAQIDEVIWSVVLNINGGTRENPELKDTIKKRSQVRRYSAIDGGAASSVYTKYLFYWSDNQTLPENLTEDVWVENPEYKADEQDGSLWMKFGVAKIDTATGEEVMMNSDKPYSDPIKLTGPRGPIAYDYRTESLFGAGTAYNAPTTWKRISEVKTTDSAPYIWEKRYLALYKMKYADKANADGTYDVVEDKYLKQIGEPDVFRLSGLNGVVGKDGKNGTNGNRLNTIDYTTTDKNLSISNFDEVNYFISNSASDTHYVLNGSKFGDFVSGYTGKFVNIGTGNMIITAVNAHIVGSNTSVTEIIVKPQESIDLIGYNNNGKSQFILVGKPVITNPVEDPGVLSETALLNAITNGGEVKLGKDIELSNRPLIIDNDVIIDLNGHTITAPTFEYVPATNEIIDGTMDSYVFLVKDGNLTIKGNGKLIAKNAMYSMAVWAQGGNVTIESGEFRNGGQDTDLIYASANGHITINGGKFIAAPKGNEPGTKNDYCALNLKNSDRATCSIFVKGGHYYGFNPAQNNSEPDNTWWEAHPNGFVADGFVSIPNGEWYSVIPAPEI